MHGFTLWNNFWYAGRYAFVGYSIVYYPLAALLGIPVLEVLAVALAAAAFALLLEREWGRAARWPGRSFAVVWAGAVITGELPFALGIALALLALLALSGGWRWTGAALTLLVVAASPVALVLLAVVLVGIFVVRRAPLGRYAVPALGLALAVATELVFLRLFPNGGALAFPWYEAVPAWIFCVVGIALVWHIERAAVLRGVFCVYLATIALAFVIPSGLGANVDRLRYLALPVALLVVSLRRWRPLPVALATVVLAGAWNVAPLAAGWTRSAADRSSRAAVWTAPVAYLHSHLGAGYRVEAVDTSQHWPAFYLAAADIPLVRGWFRQDDYPLDQLLYRRRFTAAQYIAWLRRLGTAYVVLTDAPPDYTSRREARLIRRGRVRSETRLRDAGRLDLRRAATAADRHRAGTACGARARGVAPPHPRLARRDISRRGSLVAVLACLHGLPHARARRARPPAHPRRSDGANRLRRRREQPVRRVRGSDPNLPESDRSFQVTDCY